MKTGVKTHGFAAPRDGLAGSPDGIGGEHNLRLSLFFQKLPQRKGDRAARVPVVLEHLGHNRLFAPARDREGDVIA